MADNLLIRVAGVGDHATVGALFKRSSLANEGDRDVLLQHPEVLQFPFARIEAGNVIVAERDGVIVGFASVEMGGDASAELIDLFVEPSHWRQGIGRLLVREALHRAAQNGAKALMVVGNPHSEGFYRACGFHVIGTVETQFGPGLRMRCPIE